MNVQNLTISHENTAIVYHPTLCNGDGWEVNTQGSSCTSGSNKNFTPSVDFTFTGVAVYYLSTNFDGSSISLTLDGGKSVTVNLAASVGQAPNSTASPQVVWNATGLANEQHLLHLQPVSGGKTLNVDQFVITQVDVNTTVSATPGNTTVSQSPLAGGAASALGQPVQSAKTTRISIALGTTFGTLSFLIFLAIAIFLARRTRSLRNSYTFDRPIPPIRSQHAAATKSNTHLYSNDDDSRVPTPVSLASAEPKLPPTQIQIRPLPNIAHGSFTTYDLPTDDRSDLNAFGAAGRVSPAQSNRYLLYNNNRPANSSHGHGDAVIAPHSSVRLEPVRSASQQSYSAYASRNYTDVSPMHSPPPRTHINPPSAYSAPYTVADNVVSSPSLSRNTTFSSGRLEPVRKATNTSS